MYYPYLRGRQFELIALREYALQYRNINNIIPIIEPVKKTFNSMRLALPKLDKGNISFALILNPQVGDSVSTKEIVEALSDELTTQSKWIPAFIVTNNYKDIVTKIDLIKHDDVMLICSDVTDSSNKNFDDLVNSNIIKYLVINENRTLKRKLTNKGKELIRLDDNFNAQKQNKDFLKIPEEQFSEEHLFYKEEGFFGFADYTVLGSEYIEGGFLPKAVSIHLTYKKENEEVWIRHFTSDTNDDTSNVQGKFAEAARKAVTFLDERNFHNNATDELRNYYYNSIYPGLGMIKKISIKNHLELINEILNTTGK